MRDVAIRKQLSNRGMNPTKSSQTDWGLRGLVQCRADPSVHEPQGKGVLVGQSGFRYGDFGHKRDFMGVRTAAWLIVMLLAAPFTAADDTSAPLSTLTSGDRVRLRLAEDGKRLHATVEEVRADELVLRPPRAGEPLRLSPAQLQSLEVARGRHSQWRKGALIGFVPGALFWGYVVGTGVDCYSNCPFNAGLGIPGGLVGGVLTGSVGALVGLAIKTDSWVGVYEKKPKVALTLRPAKGQAQIGVSVSF